MEQFISALTPIMLGAVLVEAVVSALTAIIDAIRSGEWGSSYKPVLAGVVGVGVSVLYGLDLFAGAGLETAVPYVGAVLSGVVVGRGSKVVYEVLVALNSYREKAQQALGKG